MTEGRLASRGTPPSVNRPRLVFGIVSVALLMSSIDQTIVATALPALKQDLHARISWAGWTITIYSLVRVLVLPLAGKLSDQYGRRQIFLSSVALFTVASLLCGLAGNIYLLVALRALQAVGGSAFMPSATGLVADGFGTQRGRAIGLFTSITPIGGVIGPILGGVLVSSWSWRWIFFVNVPIGLVLLALAVTFIPGGRPGGRRAPLDSRGAVLLAGGMLAAMLGITLVGSEDVALFSAQFLVPEAVAVLLVMTFYRHITHTAAPFIEPRMLHGRSFGSLNLINLLYGGAVLGFGALVPLYATERFHITTLASGTLLNARAVGTIAAASAASWLLPRSGYRWPLGCGFVVTSIGLLAMSASPVFGSPYGWLAIGAGVTGLGMGTTGPASMNASLQLAPDEIAAIAGLRQMFRQFGSITAVSISTAIAARSSDPGIALAHTFDAFAIVLLCALPLIRLIPEHRGGW